MTLLLAMVNDQHALLVADRRVTSDGRLVDDEQNKLCVLFCDDAKLAIAFTGLATYSTFDTSEWIATTLSDIRRPLNSFVRLHRKTIFAGSST